MKYIYLSVDDNHITEWYNLNLYLMDNNVALTFFLSHINNYSIKDWYKVKRLSIIHTIGNHGVNHLRAGVCDLSLEKRKELKKPVHTLLWDEFIKSEIIEGNKSIAEKTGYTPKHYSYPMGNRTENSDIELLKYFKTLKKGGGGVYNINDFPFVYGALDFGKRADQAFCGHEKKSLKIKDGQVFCCYMHKPIKHRLDWLINLNYKFVTIEDIINANY